MSTFHCTRCGRGIFRREDVLHSVELWDLGEYRARCYAVRALQDADTLTRYDASLHEGWYCCRFIAMRMVVDKFGTGDDLLVYEDSVVEVADGETPPKQLDDKGQVKLTARDFDAVIAAPENAGRLLWVKLGAIWCPPCRLMDHAISRLVRSGELPHVRFSEVDIDEERTLSARWSARSIPYSVLFFDGRPVDVRTRGVALHEGGIVGGLGSAQIVRVAREVLAQLAPHRKSA